MTTSAERRDALHILIAADVSRKLGREDLGPFIRIEVARICPAVADAAETPSADAAVFTTYIASYATRTAGSAAAQLIASTFTRIGRPITALAITHDRVTGTVMVRYDAAVGAEPNRSHPAA